MEEEAVLMVAQMLTAETMEIMAITAVMTIMALKTLAMQDEPLVMSLISD